MKKTIKAIDSAFRKVVLGFLGCSMFLLTMITFFQVIFRHVLKSSMHGYEELPIYLMMVSVWFAATLLTAEDNHVTLDMITLVVKNKRVLAIIGILMDVLTSGALVYFSYIMYSYAVQTKIDGTISSGLGFPKWIIAAVIAVNGVLMIFYTIKNIFEKVEVAKHGSAD